MARNDERREQIADSAIEVLAGGGARGLTFRAVDAAAGLPTGTTSNYFKSRAALIDAVAERILARLAPRQDTLDSLGGRSADHDLYADYVRDVVRRLLADRMAGLAWFELRLYGSREPALGETIAAWLRQGFEADVTFAESVGLPGGREEVALLHFAIDGLLFDLLTVPIDADIDVSLAVDTLVARIVGGGSG